MLTFCLARPMECICSCQGRLEIESLKKFYQHPFIIFPSNECYGKAAHLLYDGARSLSEPLSCEHRHFVCVCVCGCFLFLYF